MKEKEIYKGIKKEDTKRKCPKCDEENMIWDDIYEMWQCLSCGNRENDNS